VRRLASTGCKASGAGNLQAEVAGTNGLAEGDRSGSTATISAALWHRGGRGGGLSWKVKDGLRPKAEVGLGE
jgi:hypothetical protein